MAEDVEIPGDLGPYRFERRLGAGGMGEVFLAYDRRLDRRVAIKRLRSDLASAGARERLRREARAAARLGHAAVVQIFDLIETDGGDWIVMELVDGPRLADLVVDGALDLRETLLDGQQIAEGLAAAHGLVADATDAVAEPLAHRRLSREPLVLEADRRGILLRASGSTPVFANGQPVEGERLFDAEEIERGVVLLLAALQVSEQGLRRRLRQLGLL